MYGTRKYLNKGNLAAILFYANYMVKNPKFSLVTGPIVFIIPKLCQKVPLPTFIPKCTSHAHL